MWQSIFSFHPPEVIPSPWFVMMGHWWPGPGQDIGQQSREKYPASPDKEETAFWQLSLFWRGFLFRCLALWANKGVSPATCKDLLSSLALVFIAAVFSKTIPELIFRKGRGLLCHHDNEAMWPEWLLETGHNQGPTITSTTSFTNPAFKSSIWMDKEEILFGVSWKSL